VDAKGNPGKHILYLLGAGISKGAGLKTSAELLDSMVEWGRQSGDADLDIALTAVVNTLRDVNAGANIEDLLDAARSIRSRTDSCLWFLTEGFRNPLKSLEKRNPALLSKLSRIVLDRIRAELTLDIVLEWKYLENLIQLVRKSSSPCIFTLNYDLLIETVLDYEHISYATGFARPLKGSADSYMLPDIEMWPVGYQRSYIGEEITYLTHDQRRAEVRLIKLHGSLDWFRVASPAVYEGGLRISPQDRIVRHQPLANVEAMEMMIAGRSGKERTEEPFRVLLREFYLAAQQADVVVVIGYSFSDEHINRVLIDAQVFERSRSFDLVVVNGPDWPPPQMSKTAEEAWRILETAAEKCRAENLWGLSVIRDYAEAALEKQLLSNELDAILDVRHHGL